MTTLPYRAKAAFDYTAEQENELGLKKDDDLIIEEVNDSGWCLAKRGTDAGWVPQDYIEKVVETSGSPLTSKEEQEIQKTIQQLAQANADVSSTVQQQPKEGKAPNLDAKTCQRCRKAIESAFVVAKDYTFHAECFKCVTCNQELGGKAFIEKDGQFFCEDDYYTSFNPKCGHCGEIIKGQYISALNKAWHPEHFVCTVCKKPFDGSQFRKHDDKPYCDEHFAQLFATPCTKCGQNITGQVFEALGKKYHLDCFTCEVGGHKIGENVNFHAHEGKIYCPTHFEEIVLNRCSGCNQLIRGQYIKISDKYYHPECWKCKECNTVLTASTCLQVQNVWYCKTCAAKVKARAPASSAPVVDGEAERKAKEALLKIQAEKEARERAEKDKLRAAEEQKKKKEEDLAKLKAGQKSESLVGPGYSLFEVEYNLLVSDKCPSTVDPAKKELYLSDAEFMSKFKVDKAEFAKLPAWKQKNAKTTLKLF